MKRLPINLKDFQHEQLRKLAFEDKLSISEIVRRAIDEYIKRKKQEGK